MIIKDWLKSEQILKGDLGCCELQEFLSPFPFMSSAEPTFLSDA